MKQVFDSQADVQIQVSFTEVYLDSATDLLKPSSNMANNKISKYEPTWVSVCSEEEVF
jgi:hypothetical protein